MGSQPYISFNLVQLFQSSTKYITNKLLLVLNVTDIFLLYQIKNQN